MNSKIIAASFAGIFMIAIVVVFNRTHQDAPFISESEPKPLVCLDCHRSSNINTNEGVWSSQAFCYACHQKADCVRTLNGTEVLLQITPETFNLNQERHRFVACIQCHADVARTPHMTIAGATCQACHSVHGESNAHDPHLRVSCQACHFESAFVTYERKTDQVVLAHHDLESRPISLADHRFAEVRNLESCKKCHHAQNLVGAPSAVLPPKSVLCIICHNSPLALSHPIFGVAILVFFIGILLTVRFWYLGSVQGEEKSLHRKLSLSSESIWDVIFSRRVFIVLKTIILDIVLQRRILKESMGRWSMHSLIFSAILLRFFLSVVTAAIFYFDPDGEWASVLIDKNSPFTAIVNDLLGLFILLGVAWAIAQRFIFKPVHVVTEYQDNLAIGGIGALVILGFILESTRIIVTGIPDEIAMASFIGYPLAKVLSIFKVDWASIYGYLWYAHAIVAALFLAYLPFGKMRHVFNTPLTYVIEEVSRGKKENRV